MLLEGKTVLEWTQDISGAFCARVLASLGAEVIKIEAPPGGDPLRLSGPAPAPGVEGGSAFFGYLNHTKRSVTLDPATERGAEMFRDLAGRADILIETEISKGRAHDSLSLDALRAGAENLVIVSITPFGLAGGPASAPLTLQHRAGYAFHEASPVSDPERQTPVGCTENEGSLAIGVAAANAALCGLLAGATAGRAPHMDMAKFDFYASQLYPGPVGEWNDGRREFSRKRSAFGGTEVAGGLVWIVRCSDGWVIVSPREQHQWDRWMAVLGDPDWAGDASLCGDREIRKANFVRLQELMSGETSGLTRQELFDRAREGHVACLPVNYPSDILKARQLIERNFFDRLDVPGGKTIAVPGLPFRIEVGGRELERGREVRAPILGEATAEILGERLGLDAGELDRLRNTMVV